MSLQPWPFTGGVTGHATTTPSSTGAAPSSIGSGSLGSGLLGSTTKSLLPPPVQRAAWVGQGRPLSASPYVSPRQPSPLPSTPRAQGSSFTPPVRNSMSKRSLSAPKNSRLLSQDQCPSYAQPVMGRPSMSPAGSYAPTQPKMPTAVAGGSLSLIPCSTALPPVGQLGVSVDVGMASAATGYDTNGDGFIDALDTTADGMIDTIIVTVAGPLAAPSVLGTPFSRSPESSCNLTNVAEGDDRGLSSVQRGIIDTALTIFENVDSNKDGLISKMEFLAAMIKNKTILFLLLQRSDGAEELTDMQCFDAADSIFNGLAKGNRHIEKAAFVTHVSDLIAKTQAKPDSDVPARHVPARQRAKSQIDVDAMRQLFDQIDVNQSGALSKYEMVRAVQSDSAVSSVILKGKQGIRTEEDAFDAVEEVFSSMSGGKKYVEYNEFLGYFQRTELPKPEAPRRTEKRILIIGPGFGRELNPRQGAMIHEAGFITRWVHVPNPEQPGFNVLPYLAQIKDEIEEFKPDLVASASKGNLYVFSMWHLGYWQGPSLVLNAHPSLQRLPKEMPIVIAHGSNDELYSRSRNDLEQLVSTGSPNKCLLYYTCNSGQSAGGIARYGDMHNMQSLLDNDCLPRLIDAALSPAGPEVQFIWSWKDRLSESRQRAERWLGYSPDELHRHWSSSRAGTDYLYEVPRGSEEFQRIMDIYFAESREPSVYLSDNRAWQGSGILKVERVQNALQTEGSTIPYYESLRKSIEKQGVEFQPGAHTRWAFHGTDAIESIVSNPLQSFQPLVCGARLGSVWGLGTYFARDAKYVVNANFCSVGPDGRCRMLLCLLMTGIPCQGDPSHNGVLPMRQHPHRYNSTVDSLSNPEVFVVQHPSAALPAYVITFA